MSTDLLTSLDWRGITLILTLAVALIGGLIWLLRRNREDLVSLEEGLEAEREADEQAERASGK